MDIRSVTLFTPPQAAPVIYRSFLDAASTAFPFPTQTLRLATTPFPDWWAADAGGDTAAAQAFAAAWKAVGVTYVSLGPVQPGHDRTWLTRLPAILGATDTLFASVVIAGDDGRIDLARCRDMAELILAVSRLSADGFGNLYLTALANCPAGAPFFPIAYHGGGPAHFALALESADLALTAISAATTLAEARANLVAAIEDAAAQLQRAADELTEAFGIPCSGFDFSLAPFPTADKSLAGALEALGVPHVGASGSLFAAAFITDAIGRARFQRAGFNGLMLTVLEDSVLARRAAEARLDISHLLSYAAVCGVGLDTVPLPGDIDASVLTAILLDIAALATRLRKPLTARLMPFPGKSAGAALSFDFKYFADSRVMAAGSQPLARLLSGSEDLTLHPIHNEIE